MPHQRRGAHGLGTRPVQRHGIDCFKVILPETKYMLYCTSVAIAGRRCISRHCLATPKRMLSHDYFIKPLI